MSIVGHELRLHGVRVRRNERERRRRLPVLLCMLCALALLLATACTAFGVYHTVQKGETLWAISRAYNVPVKDIAVSNNIANPDELREGEQLFIPFAYEVKDVAASAAKGGPSPGQEPPETPPRLSGGGAPAQKGAAKDPGGGKGGAAAKGTAVASVPRSGTKPAPTPGRPASNGGGVEQAGKFGFIWPVNGSVTSKFGSRWGRTHNGIDIAAPRGTPIRAAQAGNVVFSQPDQRGYGDLIILDHGEYLTIYAHCDSRAVEEGQEVKRGQVIGAVGNTGNAEGTHLHFEIRHHKEPLDPQQILPSSP